MFIKLFKKTESKNRFVTALSLKYHYDKLLTVKRPEKAISCLDGIRSMSIMWVIFGHIASQVAFQLANFTEFYSFLMSGDYMALYSATVSVDSFFLIGGLLTAYLGTVGWKKATESGFLASIKVIFKSDSIVPRLSIEK